MEIWEPIHFKPIYQHYLWGGRNIVERYGRTDVSSAEPVAESWELSDRKDGMSVANGGSTDGQSLRDLLESNRDAVIGKSVCAGPFPLLIKLIDARDSLSIQVHPNDEAAARGLGEAKSEAWYVLDAAPGACVYRGFRPGVTSEDLQVSLRDGTLDRLLVRQSVVPGDFIYIPGGTVHAIGAGCLLLEVQQNSNTTFRLFDWNRVGPDGCPRDLHLDEANQVIVLESDDVHQPAEEGRCSTPYFSMETLNVGGRPLSVSDPLKGFTVIFVEEGSITIRHPGGECVAISGSTWLLPAALKNTKVVRHGTDPARIVLIRGVKAA